MSRSLSPSGTSNSNAAKAVSTVTTAPITNPQTKARPRPTSRLAGCFDHGSILRRPQGLAYPAAKPPEAARIGSMSQSPPNQTPPVMDEKFWNDFLEQGGDTMMDSGGACSNASCRSRAA